MNNEDMNLPRPSVEELNEFDRLDDMLKNHQLEGKAHDDTQHQYLK